MDDKITLAHGAGGQMSHRLMEEIILPAFDNSILNTLHDGALLNFNTHKLRLLLYILLTGITFYSFEGNEAI